MNEDQRGKLIVIEGEGDAEQVLEHGEPMPEHPSMQKPDDAEAADDAEATEDAETTEDVDSEVAELTARLEAMTAENIRLMEREGMAIHPMSVLQMHLNVLAETLLGKKGSVLWQIDVQEELRETIEREARKKALLEDVPMNRQQRRAEQRRLAKIQRGR